MSTSQEAQAQPFAYLTDQQFVVLTTYRRDGREVPTTIWFVNDGGDKIYFTTQVQSGKVKRIRNNAHVTLTPSDQVGNSLGLHTVEGVSGEIPEKDFEHAHALLRQKYGEHFDRIVSSSASATRTYLVVRPANQ